MKIINRHYTFKLELKSLSFKKCFTDVILESKNNIDKILNENKIIDLDSNVNYNVLLANKITIDKTGTKGTNTNIKYVKDPDKASFCVINYNPFNLTSKVFGVDKYAYLLRVTSYDKDMNYNFVIDILIFTKDADNVVFKEGVTVKDCVLQTVKNDGNCLIRSIVGNSTCIINNVELLETYDIDNISYDYSKDHNNTPYTSCNVNSDPNTGVSSINSFHAIVNEVIPCYIRAENYKYYLQNKFSDITIDELYNIVQMVSSRSNDNKLLGFKMLSKKNYSKFPHIVCYLWREYKPDCTLTTDVKTIKEFYEQHLQFRWNSHRVPKDLTPSEIDYVKKFDFKNITSRVQNDIEYILELAEVLGGDKYKLNQIITDYFNRFKK